MPTLVGVVITACKIAAMWTGLFSDYNRNLFVNKSSLHIFENKRPHSTQHSHPKEGHYSSNSFTF